MQQSMNETPMSWEEAQAIRERFFRQRANLTPEEREIIRRKAKVLFELDRDCIRASVYGWPEQPVSETKVSGADTTSSPEQIRPTDS